MWNTRKSGGEDNGISYWTSLRRMEDIQLEVVWTLDI